MNSEIRSARLLQDRKRLEALVERLAGRIAIKEISGNPPSRYLLAFKCRSISVVRSGTPTFTDEHIVEVVLPEEYPLGRIGNAKPLVNFKTPIFHPHVFTNRTLCIGDKIRVTEFLDLFVQRLGEIIRFNPDYINPASPANAEAIKWVQQNGKLLPTDPFEFIASTREPATKIIWRDHQ